MRGLFCILSALLFVPSIAMAQSAPSSGEESVRPWAEGVAPEEQEKALEFYQVGNQLFGESQYAQALVEYRKAIKHWDHPAIRYNMAVCLINLSQSIEAFENLKKGMAYGDEPLGKEQFARGETYKVLLEGQLGELTISCQEPDSQVSLDGKQLFTGPAQLSQIVLPGEHQVVATKEGFVTHTSTVVVLPSKQETVEVDLVPVMPIEQQRIIYGTRWPKWLPYAVLGAGVAVAVGGVPLYLSAGDTFDDYDARIEDLCPGAMGCPAGTIPDEVNDKKSKAELRDTLAVSAFAIGGAVVAGGVALAILNRPRPVGKETIKVAPTAGPDGAGVSLSMTF